MPKGRNCRKRYSAEEKTQFVLYCLSAKRSVAECCGEHQIAPSNFYCWRNTFINAGTAALQKRVKRAPKKPNDKAKVDNIIESELSLVDRYANCLRADHPLSPRPPAAAKLNIINIIETAVFSKTAALKLIVIPRSTYYRWLKDLRETGEVKNRHTWPNHTKISEREDVKEQLFKVLHAPPSEYGFNRTTWKFDDLQQALEQAGVRIGRHAIRKIISDAGYRWMKARKVLTSKDPDYRDKLEHIHGILGNLGDREGFFSIDEYGPFAVKHRQGRKLVAPGEAFTVPQWQKSKGALIMTAALELSTNQVTHFYSEKKDTEEMIKLLDILLPTHRHLDRIYLSWDAASWHVSKKLFEKIKNNNVMAYITGSTHVEVAPLPAGAQFLNVIEAVFSGMARAVIHNSSYQSKAEAKNAIDRYFNERNQYFKKNPKKAGRKIWGKEGVSVQFSESHNCKDPRYR